MLFSKIRNLKVKFLMLLLVIPLLVFVLLLFNLNFYFGMGIEACLGDCIVMISGRNFNVFLIITVLVSTYVFKEKNKLLILRQKSKQVIYVRDFLLMITIIFVLLLYVYFCTVSIGSLFATSFLNWQEQISIYCIVTKSINPSVSIMQVLWITWVFNFMSLVMLNTVYVTILFVTQKHIYGCLFLVVAVTIGYKFLHLFADYRLFHSMDKIHVHVLGFITISAISFWIGYVNAERKDYLE